jgi:hypothetical protein
MLNHVVHTGDRFVQLYSNIGQTYVKNEMNAQQEAGVYKKVSHVPPFGIDFISVVGYNIFDHDK